MSVVDVYISQQKRDRKMQVRPRCNTRHGALKLQLLNCCADSRGTRPPATSRRSLCSPKCPVVCVMLANAIVLLDYKYNRNFLSFQKTCKTDRRSETQIADSRDPARCLFVSFVEEMFARTSNTAVSQSSSRPLNSLRLLCTIANTHER